MELADPGHAVGDPAFGQHHAVLGHHADVVMVLGPVHSHKEHLLLLSLDEPEEMRSDLMDQCSRHDIPPAVRLLTARRGTL